MTKYLAIVAATIDGKIAKDSNHLSTEWTSDEDKIEFRKLLKECDVILIGSKTYETSKAPLSKRNCVVLTGKVQGPKQENPNLVFINTAVTDLKKYIADKNYKQVAILGGSQIYAYCLQNNLIDELYLTVEPVVFGQGISVFGEKSTTDFKFKLESLKQLNDQGTLLLKYTK